MFLFVSETQQQVKARQSSAEDGFCAAAALPWGLQETNCILCHFLNSGGGISTLSKWIISQDLGTAEVQYSPAINN